MMQDLEIGRIDTVMFTELSRFSRSLKDFLNIFESAQKHQCDLVCLKTDIDTTSPYKSLITKILMIFAEFEREMTSRRTSANAYERSKRGLANGGVAPLGYRRDKKRKGHLIVDPVESRIVQAIFAAYSREQSIKRAAELVRAHHPERNGLKLTRSKVHSILTNKACIGVRAIYKRDAANAQEVPAVWKPIIDPETFELVQVALRKNREQYHRHADRGRFVYLFSGLIRCGDCGQRLQGKSAWSSAEHRHHYYSHRSTCPQGGLNRVDAELVHRLALDWLRDIARDGERFEALRKEGVKRIGKRVRELRHALSGLRADAARAGADMEARIAELTRTDSVAVRRPIEQSISRLDAEKKEAETRAGYVQQEIDQLHELSTSPSLFADYRRHIRETLPKLEGSLDRGAVGKVVAALAVHHSHVRAELTPANHTGVVSALSCLAPASRQKANTRAPSLIEDRLLLPGRFLLSDPARLASLHDVAGLSVVQIARRLGVSHAGVVAALRRLGIATDCGRNGHGVKGQVPFGWDLQDCRLVKNGAEQQVIRLIRQLQGGGESLHGIARELNRRLVPTKNAGLWQANTVRLILHRAMARAAS
jgi:hypothetical protein